MAAFLPIILLGTIILMVYYAGFVYSRRNMYKQVADIPYGAPDLPLIGNALQFAGNTSDIMKTIIKVSEKTILHGGISKIWLGPKLYLAITDPSSVEIVLNTALAKDKVYRFMKPWLGNGLVTGEVDIWKRHRKMLMPTFNQRLLNEFVNIFAIQCNILVEKLEVMVGKGEFNPFEFVSPCTLDIICETAMGVKVGAQNKQNTSYIEAGISEMNLISKRMYQVWLQPQMLFNLSKYSKIEKENVAILHKFTNTVVEKKCDEYKNKQDHESELNDTPLRQKAFLDLMIELSGKENNKFTNEELREEVDTLTIAGNDTSALGSCYALMMLGCHPDVQEKVVQELRDIYGDSKRPVEKDDLPKMQYLERVIKETLRLYPMAPVVVRYLTQDLKLEKYTLPAGAGCVISIFGIQRNKQIWGENADTFDPDNFLPEKCAQRHPYNFIPFSAGPRNCIGKQYAMMSMKSLLSTVLRSYKIHSNVDYKNMELIDEILMRPKLGYHISIESRL